MELIQFISEYTVQAIIVMAVFWLGVFLTTYFNSRSAHSALRDKLLELRDTLHLEAAASESVVLARVRRAVDHKEFKVIVESMMLLRQAGKAVSEEQVRKYERRWDFVPTVIEVFPVLGILGTVCSMAVSADVAVGPASERLSLVMGSFGNAMASTIAGLLCAMVSMSLYGFFAKKVEQWLGDVRDLKTLVHRAEHLHDSQE